MMTLTVGRITQLTKMAPSDVLQELNRKHREVDVWNELTKKKDEGKMAELIGKNPFQKAEAVSKRLKAFLWGPEGSGKTLLALQFPDPVVIDMESGTDHYGTDFNFAVNHTTDPDEIMSYVTWLQKSKHQYKTLILDPITIYWAALQQKYSGIFLEREKKSPGFKFEYYKIQPSDWGIIKRELKTLVRRLTMLDMNVIVTAHQRKEYADGEFMKIIGDTFDAEKSLPYMFDTILRLYRNGDGSFMGQCVKDRTNHLPHEAFKIPAPPDSYSIFKEYFGGESLERESKPIEFITPEQKEEIETFLVMFKVKDQKLKKSLAAYNAETLDELTKENAQIIIEKFQKKEKANAAS
jgi:hypothetical protein